MPASVEKLLNSQYVQLALAALAFLIALWFVVVIARMLMGGRLRLPGGRTRQARLGIVDAFDLDRQRQLIIVRRDNTEHLIMIGGPNDLLIESEIVRVEGRRDEGRKERVDGEPRLEGRPAPRLGLEAPANGMARPEESAGGAPQPYAAPASPDEEGEGQRAPTFPLPPRRPVAPPPPERRPVSDRPSPERAPRPVEPAMIEMPPVQPAPPQDAAPTEAPLVLDPAMSIAPPMAPPPVAPEAAQPAAPAAAPRPMPPVLAPADRPVPTRPSPFLKPLPPRPPLRPLKRVTPQAVTPAAAPAPEPVAEQRPVDPRPVDQRPVDQRIGEQAAEAPRPAPAAAPVASEPAPTAPAEPKDGLESLEEEMAKLLGR